jgi:lipoprotein-releasing system ATP-binding protein
MSNLAAKDLRKTYPTPDGELVIFDSLSLSLESGDALAIVGPSGCGKSTLLHCLGTLEPPTSGTVLIDDTDPYSLSAKELAAFRNKQIGFVFQDHFLLPQLSAFQNVLVPCLASSHISDETSRRARELLEKVGLGERMNHLPSQLSGGERARVAIARALVTNPSVVLADEPTGSLDPKSADVVTDLLLSIYQAEKVALLIVTHSERLATRLPRQLKLGSV